jgi:AcrR family transcriptional regulator
MAELMLDVAQNDGHRTQQERRAATRSALLASAVSAVLETGASASVATIAREAGVSKGALQHHFDSKNDLLVAVVSSGWSDLTERFAQLDDKTAGSAGRVNAVVASMWESYRQPTCRAAFMISSDPNLALDVAERLTPIFAAARLRLDQTWRDAFADLDVSHERLLLARRFVRSHMLGMLVQRQLPSEEPAPDDELSMLCQATLLILTTPAP